MSLQWQWKEERRYLINGGVHVGGEALHDDPIHAHRHNEHASEAEGEEQLLPDIVRPEPRGEAELGAQTRGQAQDGCLRGKEREREGRGGKREGQTSEQIVLGSRCFI